MSLRRRGEVVSQSAGDETRHRAGAIGVARGCEEAAAVGEPFVPLGRVARPDDLDVAESLTQRQARIMGSDDRDAHPVGGLRTRQVEEERSDRVVGVARERRGHVEDPVRHRPVPYGPVMSRADGAAVGAVVPRWFELAVLCAVAFVAGYGLSSLVFAVIGAFHVVLVIAVSLNVGLLCALGVLRLPPRDVEARSSAGAIAAVVVTVAVVGGMTVMNGWARSQHVLSTRDPGIYLITGKWLSERSQLPIDAAVGPFATSDAVDPAAALGFFPSGYPDDPSRTGDLQPQFVHLYPALLGNADWLGGNRLAEALPALVGGLALLALFVLGSRWLPPWAAAGATAAVAVSLPQAFFSRDAFSEVPVQLFLCGGIALAVWAMTGERDRAAPAFVAGIVLGASVATRVDALVALVALPLWMSALWLDSPRRTARRLLFLGIGTAIGLAIATVDLLWRSRPYYELHRSEILSQVALFGLAVVGGVGGRARAPTLAMDAIARHALAAARGCDRICAHGRGRGVRMVRAPPPRDDDRGAEQPRRVPAASRGPRRRLGASVLRALDGVAVVVRRPGHARARRPRRRDRGVVGHSRSRTPHRSRARARRVPRADGPLLVACARRARPDVGDASLPARHDPRRRARVLRGARDRCGGRATSSSASSRSLVGVAAVVAPALVLQPVWRTSTQRGLQVATDALCASIGPDAAVVVLQDDALDQVLTQTIRSWCGVPAAGAASGFDLRAARGLSTRSGRAQDVASSSSGASPTRSARSRRRSIVDIQGTNPRELEQTLTRRPSHLVTLTYRFVAGRVHRCGLARDAIERALLDDRVVEEPEPIRHSVRVVQVRALVVRVEDREVVEADRAQGADIGLGDLAGAQRERLDVARDRGVDIAQSGVVASIEDPHELVVELRARERRAVRRRVQNRGEVGDELLLAWGQR